MNMAMTKWFGVFGLLLAASCGLAGGDRIELHDVNDLGVVAIESARFEDHGDQVFELRGLDAGDEPVALVRRRVGSIAELPQLPSVGDMGSEIIISVRDHQTRIVTRATSELELAPVEDPASREFVKLAAVSSVLRDADIIVTSRTTGESAFYQAVSCPSDYLLTSPLARQCCYDDWARDTLFINPSGTKVYRTRNYYGTGCKAMDGVSSCLGTDCYYGPNGFTRAQMQVPNAGNVWTVQTYGGQFCTAYQDPREIIFPDVAGAYPAGQVCPGGNNNSAGYWDY